MNAKRLFVSYRLALPMVVLAIILVAAVGAVAVEPGPEGPLTTSFTYQGRLANGGGDPIGDSCDFQFGLWDDPDAGSPVGPALNLPGVAVVDGLFTVPLDFGEVFDGTALWLEVAVKCSGDPDYTTLTPRQALTAAPYAAHALQAEDADMVDGSHASAFAPAGHGHWGASWTGTGTGLTLSGGTTGLSGSGTTYGVYGQSDSGYGVYGQSDSAWGVGVYGTANSSDAGSSAVGVTGISYSKNGYGGWFAAATYGVAETTQAGLYAQNDSDIGYGVVGRNSANGTGIGAWSYTGRIFQGYSGYGYPSGTLRFYVTNGGAVWADDGFYTFKETDGGEHRTLYSMTSAEAWTEDFGRATLNNGMATVSIDPIFARTVNLTLEYHVYLTPICSDLIVLAVTGQRPDSFTVQGATLDGKPSGCAFDYRIVAKQRGHEDERLEKVDIPEPVEVDREDSHAPGVVGPEPEGGR